METRKELPKLFQDHSKIGVGVEVGVWRGEFTEEIFKEWNGVMLLVDSWKDVVPGLDMNGAFVDMIGRMLKYKERARIANKDSLEAVKMVPDEMIDWVYIDADHTYDAVVKDIAAWSTKVRPGGIVAGHDYFDGQYAGIEFGVKTAVDEYVEAHGYKLNTTTEADFKSWWFVKE